VTGGAEGALGRADAICALLGGYRFACSNEAQLQQAIEELLRQAGYQFMREKHLSRKDKPDFDVGGVAIEVKVDGSLTDVLRQLSRYAEQPAVDVLVLVTTRATHARVPTSMGGKPIRLVHLVGALG
jgi:hypothetical protein